MVLNHGGYTIGLTCADNKSVVYPTCKNLLSTLYSLSGQPISLVSFTVMACLKP